MLLAEVVASTQLKPSPYYPNQLEAANMACQHIDTTTPNKTKKNLMRGAYQGRLLVPAH
jgi:hypothetical protein